MQCHDNNVIGISLSQNKDVFHIHSLLRTILYRVLAPDVFKSFLWISYSNIFVGHRDDSLGVCKKKSTKTKWQECVWWIVHCVVTFATFCLASRYSKWSPKCRGPSLTFVYLFLDNLCLFRYNNIYINQGNSVSTL